MNLVIENQILSPVYIWSKIDKSAGVLIERFDNYNKRTYRNRFIILSQNGPLTISIPLKKGKNRNTPFKEVKISYDKNWISNLKNTIKTCYGSAPYFEFYFDEIMDIFNKKHSYLFDLNNDLRKFVIDTLEIDTPIDFTKEFNLEYSSDFEDIRDKYTPVKDINNPKNDIISNYPQVFEYKTGFFPNISIIDAIFNLGRQAQLIL